MSHECRIIIENYKMYKKKLLKYQINMRTIMIKNYKNVKTVKM